MYNRVWSSVYQGNYIDLRSISFKPSIHIFLQTIRQFKRQINADSTIF